MEDDLNKYRKLLDCVKAASIERAEARINLEKLVNNKSENSDDKNPYCSPNRIRP